MVMIMMMIACVHLHAAGSALCCGNYTHRAFDAAAAKKCGLVKNLLALAPRVQFEVMNESWCSMVMTWVSGGEGLKAFLHRKSSLVNDEIVLGTTRRSREKKTSIG